MYMNISEMKVLNKNVLDTMETRSELYENIGYHAYEQKLDELFKNNRK